MPNVIMYMYHAVCVTLSVVCARKKVVLQNSLLLSYMHAYYMCMCVKLYILLVSIM